MNGEEQATPAGPSALPGVAAGLLASVFAAKAAVAPSLGCWGAFASGVASAFALFAVVVMLLLCRHGAACRGD